MYKLGHTLRNRYGWLIPKHGMYTWDTTTVLSSASERCILSAQSLLASFYEPPAGAINMTIAWQPVPVTVLDRSQDTVNIYFPFICVTVTFNDSILDSRPAETMSQIGCC